MHGNLSDADGMADADTSGIEGSDLPEVLYFVNLEGMPIGLLD